MYDIVFNNGGNSEHDVKMYFEISTFLEKFSFKMKACVIHGWWLENPRVLIKSAFVWAIFY